MFLTRSYGLALGAFVVMLALGCETADPEILRVTELQDTAGTLGPYHVTAEVVGIPDEIVVQLFYRVDGTEELNELDMTWIGGHVWHVAIPGHPVGTTIDYFVAVARADALDKPITMPEGVLDLVAPAPPFQFHVIDGG
jgi:hypothetical protein